MTEIYLEGNRLSLYDRTRISYNLQNNDVFKPSLVQVSHTNRFTIPIYPNLQYLENLGLIGHQSTKPYRELAIRIVEDGIEFYNDGKAIITESKNKKDIEIITRFEGGLFNIIKDQTLRQLDLSSLDHTLSLANLPFGSSDYFYPSNRNYTKGKTGNDLLDMLPALAEKKLLSEIFSQNNWTYEWGDEAETDHAKTYLTPEKGYSKTFFLTQESGTQVDNRVETNGTTSEFEIVLFSDSLQNGVGTFHLDLLVNSFNITVEEIEFTTPGFTFSIRYEWRLGDSTNDVSLGDNLQIDQYAYSSLSSNSLSLHVFVTASNFSTGYSVDIDYDVEYNTSFYVWNETQAIQFEEIIPDTNQLDFLKDIINRYGLAVKKEKFQDKIIFKRFENIFNDRSNALDWSDKLQEEESVEYQTSTYGQTNIIDFQDESTNTGRFTVDNENLDTEKTIYTSQYGGDLSDIDIYEETLGDFGEIESKESSEIDAKIGTKSDSDSSVDVEVFGVDRGSKSMFTLDEVDLQTNVDAHYPSLKKILDRLELFTFRMYLTKVDIYNFDPFKIIYLKQYSSYFYIKRISNYRENFGKVECLKIPSDL